MSVRHSTIRHPISRRSLLRAGGVAAAGAALGVGAAPAAGAGVPGPSWHARLSLEQQVGQRVVFSYPGATPPDDLLEWIAAAGSAG